MLHFCWFAIYSTTHPFILHHTISFQYMYICVIYITCIYIYITSLSLTIYISIRNSLFLLVLSRNGGMIITMNLWTIILPHSLLSNSKFFLLSSIFNHKDQQNLRSITFYNQLYIYIYPIIFPMIFAVNLRSSVAPPEPVGCGDCEAGSWKWSPAGHCWLDWDSHGQPGNAGVGKAKARGNVESLIYENISLCEFQDGAV